MMMYYNAMLVQINHYIKEQVESEKKKKGTGAGGAYGADQPHFLYNTLENIVWKSNEVGRPDIGRIGGAGASVPPVHRKRGDYRSHPAGGGTRHGLCEYPEKPL